MKISTIALLTSVAAIGSIIVSGILIYDRFVQTENEIQQINTQLELMTEQLEDTRHENIITRINNAQVILANCDIDKEEKSVIGRNLYDAARNATLLNDFDGAEATLNQHAEDLSNCEISSAKIGFSPDSIPSMSPLMPTISFPITVKENMCKGTAACIAGVVTQIIDGDTLEIGQTRIRLALTSTPELDESGGQEAKQFVEEQCPKGSVVLVDEDDGQIEGSFGRMIAKVYCNDILLNEILLENEYAFLNTNFCEKSEFSSEAWAKKFGC